MARSLEPYRDRFLPDQFQRWLEFLRGRIGTVPCFVESTGSPEGVIAGQKGDFYFDTGANVYYYKTTDTGNTGWAVLSVGVTPPGGADTEIQFNNAGSFGGITAGIAGTVLTSNGVGVTPSYQASGAVAPGTVTDALLRWSGAAWVENTRALLTDTTARLNLGNGVSTSPWLEIDVAVGGNTEIRMQEGGANRARLNYIDFTDQFDIETFVTGSIITISPDNTVVMTFDIDAVNISVGTADLSLNSTGASTMQSADGTAGEQLSIFAGAGTAGNGGLLALSGGDGTVTGGNLNLQSGDGGTGNGGDINIRPGAGVSSLGGFVSIQSALAATSAPNLLFAEAAANGTTFISLRAPASVTTARFWTLMQDDPAAVAGQFITTDASGILSFAAASAAAAGATNEIQFNTAGALDADPFISLDLTAGSGQAPQLRLDGTSGSYRRPTLVFNYDLSDEGGIEWEEEGGVRGYIRYYATGPGGGTDVLRIWNPVNGGATSNSITEIGAENLLRYRANEEGNDFRGPIRIDGNAAAVFPDTVNHGVIFLDSGDGDVKFRNSAGAEFSMTSGLAPAGNVNNTGTPLNNQVAVWTDATTIEGDPSFIFDNATDSLTLGPGTGSPTLTIDGGGIDTNATTLLFQTGSIDRARLQWFEFNPVDGFIISSSTFTEIRAGGVPGTVTALFSTAGLAIAAGRNLTLATTQYAHFNTGQTTSIRESAAGVLQIELANLVEYEFTAAQFTAGNYLFNIDETVGAGQDNFVLTYDNGTGQIGLEAAAGGGGSPWTYTLQVGTSYTAVAGDFVVASNTGTVTITLPSGHSVNDTIIVKKTGATGIVTVDANASETIDGALTFPLSTQYDSVTLISDGTNWLVV